MRVAVDTGGTFTDFRACTQAGQLLRLKRASTPNDPAEAILQGIETLERQAGEVISRLDHGTTVATNAVLESKTSACLLVVNANFEDLLLLGRQERTELFALEPKARLSLLSRDRVLGVRGRLTSSGEELEPLEDLDAWMDRHKQSLEEAQALAICLLHSCTREDHEVQLATALSHRYPQLHLSLSHQIAAIPREYERALTTTANAAVAPLMDRYLGRLQTAMPELPISLMASDGSLMGLDQARAQPVRSLLSGPAGGLMGAWRAARLLDEKPLLSLDMGGTSTDVAAVIDKPSCRQEGQVGPYRLAQEVLPIETVGAGGGSIAWIDTAGLLQVGPQSAGAEPGPAAYGRGGTEATVTDANVVLGRLPQLLGGRMSLDKGAAEAAVDRIAKRLKQPRVATALAILRQAEARMARACRRVTVAQGIDPRRLRLVAFGGAGGLHAAALCDELGCQEFLVPADAGLLSAQGILEARPQQRRSRSLIRPLADLDEEQLEAIYEPLEEAACQALSEPPETVERRLRLRYPGQGADLELTWPRHEDLEALRSRFHHRHMDRYGFATEHEELELVQISVLAQAAQVQMPARGEGSHKLDGPQVLPGEETTIWLPKAWSAEISDDGAVLCRRRSPLQAEDKQTDISLSLEIHHQRLAAIAEEMGERLCRAARSTNIKERRDCSCAVFDGQGQMLGHAAHIPVHLGATPASVQAALDSGLLKTGGEVLLNDPYAGGSHLPDLTLVTGLAGGSPRFYAANRAHHADVGGITPGSLPSSVTPDGFRPLTIDDEGLRLGPTRLDSDCFERVASASRSPRERRGDLAAQRAANLAGLQAVSELEQRLGPARFQQLNQALLDLGETLMRQTILAIPNGNYSFSDHLDDDGLGGAPVKLKVQIKVEDSSATIDLREVPDQLASPINAARSVTESAVLYVFCCLAAGKLPANGGMLRPLTILTRAGSLLHPREPAPVSAGNVETSQRIVDLLFGALAKALPARIPAASGGSMSNLLFGALDGDFVHYETLACGAGAGPGGPGASAIQTHMTNTLNTPIERLEQCFPVRVERYSLAPEGEGNGGQGVLRSLRFLEPVLLSLSGERRRLAPWGIGGAASGPLGQQWLESPEGSRQVLPGKISLAVAAQSLLTLQSPGGGGWQA